MGTGGIPPVTLSDWQPTFYMESAGERFLNYYERHLGDYSKDTAHLSMIEHGAYGLLLDRYYGTEQGIPEDQAHRVARARTREEKNSVDVVLKEFFILSDGVWINQRAEEEIAKARVKIKAAQDNGRKGGRPKTINTGSENGTQDKPAGLFTGSENGTQDKAHQTPDTMSTSNEVDSAKNPRFVPFSFLTKIHGVDKQVAKDWLALRKVKKLAPTETALNAVVREAEKAGLKMPEVIAHCCEKGWGGFNANWEHGLNGNKAKSGNWFMSSSGITAKGAEKGIIQSLGESFPAFKSRVYQAFGVTEEMVRNAQADMPKQA